ncbi:hypothetical protein BGX33_001749 [Mortierella sp. NVP41]|nr:hypothetical protein BGX33_001749 [Mortierella sp. NVP41]
MSSATTRFFNLPELLAILAEFLQPRDLSRLMLTSRILRVLTRNRASIQTLKFGDFETSHLYNNLADSQTSSVSFGQEPMSHLEVSLQRLQNLIRFEVTYPYRLVGNKIDEHSHCGYKGPSAAPEYSQDAVAAGDAGGYFEGVEDWHRSTWFQDWSDLLRVCPPTLRTFNITPTGGPFLADAQHQDYLRSVLSDNEHGGDLQWEQHTFPHLGDLLMGLHENDEFTTTVDVRIVLQRCPNTETLRVLDLYTWMDGEDLFSNLPDNQFEELHLCSLSLEEIDLQVTRMALLTHSQSLRVIRFDYGLWISPTIAGSQVCAGLEELTLFPPNDISMFDYSHIRLVDADVVAARPWACTSIRMYGLSVEVPALQGYPSELAPVGHPFYERPSPIVLSEDEGEKFALLERFYQQLGALRELNELELRVILAEAAAAARRRPQRRCNPELRASVRLSIPETKATVARWMDASWPSLRVAKFFNNDEELSEPFK